MTSKLFLISAAASGALAVMLGAFGAHALKETLQARNLMPTYETGVQYQFYHTLALLGLGVLLQFMQNKWLIWSGYSWMAGVLIFSGSLYVLCLTGISKWGAVTPIGGLLLIAGWVFLLVGVLK